MEISAQTNLAGLIKRVCVLSALLLGLAARQSPPSPLSRTDLLGLMASHATLAYAAHLVQERGISFQFTDEYVQMARRVGGGDSPAFEQILRASSVARSAEALSGNEAALLPHLARCGELKHSWLVAEGPRKAQSTPSEAESECRAALALSPQNVFLLMALGGTLEQDGKWEEAIAVLRQAVALNPELSELHYLLADILTRKGDRDAALREGLEALRLDPNNVDVFLYYVFLFGDAGTSDSEISMLRSETLKHPKDAATHWILGMAYSEGKSDKENSIKEFREAVRFDPSSAWYHYYLSGALQDAGDIRGAIIELETARKLDPSNVMFREQ